MSIDNNDFFHQVNLRICGSIDLTQALENTLGYLKNYIPIDAIILSYGDSKQGTLYNFASVDPKDLLPYRSKVKLSAKARLLIQERMILLEDSSYFIVSNNNDLEEERLLQEFYGIKSDKEISSLSMSVSLNDYFIGMAVIVLEGSNRYSSRHKELFSLLNEAFKIAISNHQSFKGVVKTNRKLREDRQELLRELRRIPANKLIGGNTGLKNVMKKAYEFSSLDVPILLLGEAGVGKGIVANEIHSYSHRCYSPFVKVNCRAGKEFETLIESEIFGHARGIFAGANILRPGKLELADGGTILLDEIGNLSAFNQSRLLDLIKTSRFKRLGGTKIIHVDVRVIASSRYDLGKMVEEKLFNEELWGYLNNFSLKIPPLNQRKEDIPDLVDYFIKKKAKKLNIFPIPKVKTAEMDYMINKFWTGNVRELENIIERALIKIRGKGADFLSVFKSRDDLIKQSAKSEADEIKTFFSLDQVQKRHIKKALKLANGKIHGAGGAAELLKINPHTLRSRMKKLKINF